MTKQLDFLHDTLSLLAEDPHFVSRIEFFREQSISRWENWLQMELLLILGKRNAEFDWESRYSYHGKKIVRRPTQNKTIAYIDILFRQKGADCEIYTAVELKAKLYPDRSIGEAIKDLLRISALKQTNFRAVYAIAAYQPLETGNQSAYEKLVEKLNGKFVDFGASWRLVLFGWEGAPRSGINNLKKEYETWCQQLVDESRSTPRIQSFS